MAGPGHGRRAVGDRLRVRIDANPPVVAEVTAGCRDDLGLAEERRGLGRGEGHRDRRLPGVSPIDDPIDPDLERALE